MELKSFETIGRRIKQARKAKNLDQVALAQKMDILPSRISLLERDRANLIASEASYLCKILAVDLNWLVDGTICSDYELFLTLNLNYHEYLNQPENSKESWLDKHTQRFALQSIEFSSEIKKFISRKRDLLATV